MIRYQQCPSCGSEKIQKEITVKDHSVSGEEFEIWRCSNCHLFFTQHIPDESEIGKYYRSENYISHSDTRKGIVNKLYHLIREYTLGQKKNLLQKSCGLQRGSLLDIGSGTGSFLTTMQKAGWEITGIEPDKIARKNSEELHHIKPLEPAAIKDLPSSSFDAITMWHVMEHVHQLQNQFKELNRLIKPEGRVFIAVPNHTSGDADHYRDYWAAWDVPRHLYHFSPESMRFLAGKFGFTIENYKPMWFDSFYVSMLSEKYKSGKSHLLSALISGIKSNLKAMKNVEHCSSVIYILEKVR